MQLERGELGLADGREVEIGVRSNDEIGLLGEIFEKTIGNLRAYIGEIDEVLGAIAKGDLTQNTQQDYTGDFKAIKESLESILRALNQTMGQIAASAGHVSDGSEQVSASAQTLAQGLPSRPVLSRKSQQRLRIFQKVQNRLSRRQQRLAKSPTRPGHSLISAWKT